MLNFSNTSNTSNISKQKGFSLMGFLVVGILLALAGIIGAQILPTFIEYRNVIKSVNRAAAEEAASIAEIRANFDKNAAVDDITSIKSKDLDITKENGKVVINFAYQREIHLTGPMWLTMKYAGKSGK